jgi:hypothetical protein
MSHSIKMVDYLKESRLTRPRAGSTVEVQVAAQAGTGARRGSQCWRSRGTAVWVAEGKKR